MDVMKPKRTEKVIDVGVAPVVGIAGAKTITNNFFERLYPYTAQITATSIEDAKCLEQEFPGLKFVQTKPYTTPFSDGMFDVLFAMQWWNIRERESSKRNLSTNTAGFPSGSFLLRRTGGFR